jgi:hypothetical protein
MLSSLISPPTPTLITGWRTNPMQTIVDATLAAIILIPGLCYLWG